MAPQTFFSSSSSSSSFGYGCSYDVFLSFRGTDTRYGFTGYLYKALCNRGINTYIDDEELPQGEEITPSLVKAIQESRIAIPVFSTNYAASSFCLEELANIIECFKANGRLVLPVFYNVNPSDVRHQNNSYGEAMAKHEERFKDDMKVKRWREALSQVADLSGYHFTHGDGYEHKFIEKIVDAVSGKIKRVFWSNADYPVGLEYRVTKVTSLMDVGTNEGVYMVGIHGIGGVGKTTLALAVYNSIADHFESSCFLENVRENSNKNGMIHLQNIILSELLGEKKINITSARQGISIIQQRLQKKKVLLILDDVDNQEQLRDTIGKHDLFGPGSRVIITTRDKHLLKCYGVERTYEVECLYEAEALELLCRKAFKTVNVNPCYVDVLNRAVTYASGLPLALEVIGSNLFGKHIEEWESALDQYERIPNPKIYSILKVSFDALGEVEQSVFLDIVCCFKGYAQEDVEELLHAHHGRNMKYQIEVLVDKSLVKIGWLGTVTLHDLIEDMGKEIIRKESPKEPGKRSQLWFHEDIIQVLKDNQGTDEIEIIHLDFPSSKKEKEVEWDVEAFKKMEKLKTLIIRNGHFLEGPKHLPNSLRVLEWWRYPSQSLPCNFHPKKLCILKLPKYCCMSLDLPTLLKKFVELTVLNFDDNKYLTKIPDVSSLRNLEKLSFKFCKNLTTIHDSIGFLEKLKTLNAKFCFKLRSFPPIKLPSLETLELSGCVNLENFPEILGKMEKITKLELEETGIEGLPFSFGNLARLQSASFVALKCPNMTIASDWDGSLTSKEDEGGETVSSIVSSNVEHLCFKCCKLSDNFFPKALELFANVKELDLCANDLTIIPACIKECRFLRKLVVDNCRLLRKIRGIPPNLEHFSARNCTSLTFSSTRMLLNQDLHEAGNTLFILPRTWVPEWFEHRSREPTISFWFRNKFPALALCLAVGSNPLGFSGKFLVIINDKEHLLDLDFNFPYNLGINHIYLFDLQKEISEDNLNEALLENVWNHAEFSLPYHGSDSGYFVYYEEFQGIGIHVFKQKSNMEDIRFTDPLNPHKRSQGTLVDDSFMIQGQLVDDNLSDSQWKTDISMTADLSSASKLESDTAASNQKHALSNNQEPSDLVVVLQRDSGLDSIKASRTMDYEIDFSFSGTCRRSSIDDSNDNVNKEIPVSPENEKTNMNKSKVSGTRSSEKEKSKGLHGSSQKGRPEIVPSNRRPSLPSKPIVQKSKREQGDEIRKKMEELSLERQRRIAERTASSGLARATPRKDQVEGKKIRVSAKTDKNSKTQSVKETNRINSAKVREI